MDCTHAVSEVHGPMVSNAYSQQLNQKELTQIAGGSGLLRYWSLVSSKLAVSEPISGSGSGRTLVSRDPATRDVEIKLPI